MPQIGYTYAQPSEKNWPVKTSSEPTNKPNEKKITNDIKLGKKNDIQAKEQLQHLPPPKSNENLNLTSPRNPTEFATIIGRQENALNNFPVQTNALMTTHHYRKDGANNDHVEDIPKTEKIDPYLVTNELDHIVHIAAKVHNALTNPERRYPKRDATLPKTAKDDASHANEHPNHQEDPRYDEQALLRMVIKIDHHADVT